MDDEDEPSTFEFKKGTGAGFSAVAGMEELKAQIRRDYIDLLLFDGLAKEYGIAPPNGMVLRDAERPSSRSVPRMPRS